MNIKPYEKNAKEHPKKQIELIAKSIKRFGWQQPIKVGKDNIIIVGHGRWMAWSDFGTKLGLKEPWIIDEGGKTISGSPETTPLSDLEEKAYRMADNQINALSSNDMTLIVEELKLLDDELIDLTGFDKDLIIEPEEKDDEVPDVPEEPQSKLGDLYELGNHRVLCGDSTKLEDVERLMDGKKADMVFTDPPYKIQTEGGTRSDIAKSLRKQGKSIEFIADFNPTDFLNTLPLFFDGTMNAYVFCNKELLPDYLVWARDCGYSFNVLVWKKPNAIPIGDSHRPDIEYLLLFRKNAIWNNGLSQTVNYSRLIESKRETGLHPTMKPVDIITNQIKISSHSGSLVVDAFLGSGSTLIASEKTGRNCYGMELDEKYIDVIIERWCQFTGIRNIKKNGQDYYWEAKE